MILQRGTHHRATITRNESIAVRATKTLMGSQRMPHTPVPSNQQSRRVWNSHSERKISLDTRGQNTPIRPAFVTGAMTALTLRWTRVLPSQPRLDAPPPTCVAPHVVPFRAFSPVLTRQKQFFPSNEPFSTCDSSHQRPFPFPKIAFHTAWPLDSWRGWFTKLIEMEPGMVLEREKE